MIVSAIFYIKMLWREEKIVKLDSLYQETEKAFIELVKSNQINT